MCPPPPPLGLRYLKIAWARVKRQIAGNAMGIFSCSAHWRHFLETGPDPIAMVIRVELFTLKPSQTIQICTAWLLTHDFVTGGVCLAGLWMNSSTLITMAIGSGPVSRNCLPVANITWDWEGVAALERSSCATDRRSNMHGLQKWLLFGWR